MPTGYTQIPTQYHITRSRNSLFYGINYYIKLIKIFTKAYNLMIYQILFQTSHSYTNPTIKILYSDKYIVRGLKI